MRQQQTNHDWETFYQRIVCTLQKSQDHGRQGMAKKLLQTGGDLRHEQLNAMWNSWLDPVLGKEFYWNS